MFTLLACLWLGFIGFINFAANRFFGGFVSMLMVVLVWASASKAVGGWASVVATIYLFVMALTFCINGGISEKHGSAGIVLGAISAFIGVGLLLA